MGDLALRGEPPLRVWVSIWTSYLVSPKISGGISGMSKKPRVTIDVPVPSLAVLSGYRRWSVQAPQRLLVGMLARVTFIDSWEFMLLHVSN